jgi:hypothetical protein
VGELEWLTSPDPVPMCWHLGVGDPWGPPQRRKWGLLAVAFARVAGDLMEPEALDALDALERFADGRASGREVEAATAKIRTPGEGAPESARGWAQWAARYASWGTTENRELILEASFAAASAAGHEAARATGVEVAPARQAARVRQADLARCLFGNPFRPTPADPARRTPGVVRLAEAVYAERAFDRLPLLADLLEEAGATDVALLGHLRGPGPHALGCHALDAVLAKG